jgi:hypothetical protein
MCRVSDGMSHLRPLPVWPADLKVGKITSEGCGPQSWSKSPATVEFQEPYTLQLENGTVSSIPSPTFLFENGAECRCEAKGLVGDP